jgi:hypothetical protein
MWTMPSKRLKKSGIGEEAGPGGPASGLEMI